jgi:hypothetical protein
MKIRLAWIVLGAVTVVMSALGPPRGRSLAGQETSAAAPSPFTFRISFGAGNSPPADWDGTLTVEDGQIELCNGWHLGERDSAALPGWKIRTEQAPAGVTVYGSGLDATRIRVSTVQGSFDFTLREIRSAGVLHRLDGRVEVTWLLSSSRLTTDFNEDDFPSIAEAPDGTAYAVWASFTRNGDQIRLRRYTNGRWATFTVVPNVEGDVWKPQVAIDGRGQPWIVWSEQISGNWDLYARNLASQAWGPRIRLTDAPGADTNHHLMSDSAGDLHVVWQGYRDGDFNIYLRSLRGDQWDPPVAISEAKGNDWEPSVASDGRGRMAVVWDSYRSGDYDVFLRTFEGGKWGKEIAVAATPYFEAHASAAIDRSGRVWIAWEQGGAGWGKDRGYMLAPGARASPESRADVARHPGSYLGAERGVRVRCYSGGLLYQTAASPAEALPVNEREYLQWPKLAIDREGRVWLHLRRRVVHTTAGPGPQTSRSVWQGYLTRYDTDRWTRVWELPDSFGRISSQSALVAGAAGNIWLAWPTDNRRWWGNSHAPVINQVYAGFMRAEGPLVEPRLSDPQPEPAPQVAPGHRDEKADIEAARRQRARVGSADLRLVRGDLHRHTELSWDGGGINDGSVLDFYRYMIDVAAMDFGAVTDHNGGGDSAYSYWLIQKTTDIFFLPGRYVSLYGYERSALYPNGHRNVIQTRRGIPVVTFFTQTTVQTGRPGIATGDLLENDTKLLYEVLRRTGGIAISHTSATGMGTDWRDNDPAIEPVVEIYQGARSSYEFAGAPRAAELERDKQLNTGAGYQPAGFVNLAWKKGYRLGTIASSDHNSTHISYAFVYVEDFTREGVLEGIRKRRTYGATDNVVLEFRIGEHFMGEEFESRAKPRLRVKVRGTGPVARVEVRRNDESLTEFYPGKVEFDLTYEDSKAAPGLNRYYVRVEQADGQLAWSSPIWVNLK